jgi:AcrR family transcriptional regulator
MAGAPRRPAHTAASAIPLAVEETVARATARAETDGRVERSRRNRKAIVEALFELISEGELLPTGEQVANRAGVGLRTVFRHFEDMESLHAEISSRLERVIRPLLETPIAGGDLAERVGALVQQRADAFERMAPFMRSSEIQRWRSTFIQNTQAEMVRHLRNNLRNVLPEIDDAPPPLAHAVELLASYESWDRLRSAQGLGRERAAESLRSALLTLLTA